jgi:hypothetical protein
MGKEVVIFQWRPNPSLSAKNSVFSIAATFCFLPWLLADILGLSPRSRWACAQRRILGSSEPIKVPRSHWPICGGTAVSRSKWKFPLERARRGKERSHRQPAAMPRVLQGGSAIAIGPVEIECLADKVERRAHGLHIPRPDCIVSKRHGFSRSRGLICRFVMVRRSLGSRLAPLSVRCCSASRVAGGRGAISTLPPALVVKLR